MRKIEKAMLEAIANRKSVNLGNTTVTCTKYHECVKIYVELFGNQIAEIWPSLQYVAINLAGRPNRTTLSRLNALLPEPLALRTVKGSVYRVQGNRTSEYPMQPYNMYFVNLRDGTFDDFR